MNGKYSSKNEEDCNEFDDVQLVTDALRYAQGNGYRPYRSDCSKNSKRSIRQKAKRFVVNNGDVHYRKKNGTLVSIYIHTENREIIIYKSVLDYIVFIGVHILYY